MNCKETNKFEEFVNYKNSQNEYKNNLENTHNRNNKSNNECAICENNYSQQNPQNSRISKNWQGCNSTNLMPTTPNAQSNNKLESSKGEIEIQGANRLSFSSKKNKLSKEINNLLQARIKEAPKKKPSFLIDDILEKETTPQIQQPPLSKTTLMIGRKYHHLKSPVPCPIYLMMIITLTQKHPTI